MHSLFKIKVKKKGRKPGTFSTKCLILLLVVKLKKHKYLTLIQLETGIWRGGFFIGYMERLSGQPKAFFLFPSLKFSGLSDSIFSVFLHF